MKNILLFSGSNNPKSINQSLIVGVADLINSANKTVIDLRDFPLPIYSIEIQQEGVPENAITLKRIITEHDALIISIAEHNGSVTAFFKNTIDWLSRVDSNYKVFDNKAVLLLSASPGVGGSNAINHADTILTRLGAKIIGKTSITNFYQQTYSTNEGLQFKDPSILKEITNKATYLTVI